MTATRERRPTSNAVRQIALPPDARALSTLSRIDYEDAFAVTAEAQHTAEEWMRAVLYDAPPSVRRGLWLGWTALGVKLGPPWASDRVLGWKVKHSDPDGLLFATLVQQTNPAVRVLWAAITPRHQHVVRSLLSHAARRAQDH